MQKVLLYSLLFLCLATACRQKANKPEEKTDNKEAATTGSVHLTTESFKTSVFDFSTKPDEWKYLGDKPCIIDFYATWCGPCKMIAPILEELATEYSSQMIVYKIDVDEEPEVAQFFGIQSLPTLLFCPMEGAPQTVIGAMPKESFKQAMKEILSVE